MDKGSQGDYLVVLSDGTSTRSLISWQSKKIRRIVKSTIAAETLALLDVAQAGVYYRHILLELLNVAPVVKCFVDNRSLVEALHSTKLVEDKHLRIDIAALKNLLENRDISSVSWVQSSLQLADVLTKHGASSAPLLEAIQSA